MLLVLNSFPTLSLRTYGKTVLNSRVDYLSLDFRISLAGEPSASLSVCLVQVMQPTITKTATKFLNKTTTMSENLLHLV